MNAGYQFYKGYFADLDYTDLKSGQNADKIKCKNEELLQYTLPNTLPNVPIYPTADIKKNINVNCFRLTSVYPGLLIGAGYTHEIGVKGELKLGFSFDHASGIPYIPGSSIKGIIRNFFPKFTIGLPASEKRYFPKSLDPNEIQRNKIGFIQETLKLSKDIEDITAFIHKLELYLFEGVDPEKKNTQKTYLLPRNQVLSFMDAFPVDSEKQLLENDAITPHNSVFEEPIPLPFIKIGGGVAIEFMFYIPPLHPYFKIEHETLIGLFKTILIQAGIGAKTNTGYGRLEEKKAHKDPNNRTQYTDHINTVSFEKGNSYDGKVVSIENKMVQIMFEGRNEYNQKVDNFIYKGQGKIIGNPVSVDDAVVININADYKKNSSTQKLNCKVTKK